MKLTRKTITSVICFSLLLVLLLLTRCEDEKPVSHEYPRISGTRVINISDSGATFTADLYSIGTEAMREYGFLWDVYGELDYYSSNKVILGKPEKTGVFTSVISTSLRKDLEYNVRPFVKTENRLVYGPVTSFKSQGSKAPVIYGFEPDSAIWLDTLRIKGKNFSWIAGQNIVKLNEVQCLTYSGTDTTLKVVVSNKIFQKNCQVSIELAGSTSMAKKTFKIILPEIKNIPKKDFLWRDTVLVLGKNFTNPFMYSNILTSTIGGVSCDIIKKTRDSLFIIFGDNINTTVNDLVLVVNGFTPTYGGKLNLAQPVISSIKPGEGTWGSTISIYGKFHPLISKNTFKVGSYPATVSSFSKDSVKVKIPSLVSARMNAVSLTVPPYTVFAADSLRLFPPVIRSISPLTGRTGNEITIKGRYLNNNSSYSFTKVWLGNTQCTVYSANDSVVICNIPEGTPPGAVKISAQAGSQTKVSESDFIVTNPGITSFFPLSCTFEEEVAIYGDNLFLISPAYTRVDFVSGYSSYSAEIISVTNNIIKVKTPLSLDSLSKRIKVSVGGVATTSDGFFTLSPQVISGTDPSVITSGGIDLTINGTGFNPLINYNHAYWNSSALEITSASPTRIIVRIPQNFVRGTGKVDVSTGGYHRTVNINSQVRSVLSGGQ